MNRALAVGLLHLLAGSGAASAHSGDHSGLGWAALAGHLTERDHLVFLALVVLVGLLAFRLGCRAERRVRDRSTP